MNIQNDIFALQYQRWIDLSMVVLKPVSTTPHFVLAQMLYDLDKNNFVVISGLHSNDIEDKLHFSVAVNGKYKNFTLHFYGFWRSDFKIAYITMQTTDNVSGKLDCGRIAEFAFANPMGA